MTGTAIVTGASRGIGAATARALARDGFTVVVNFRSRREAADSVVAAIQEAGGQAVAMQADVGRHDEVVRLFQRVDAELGPLTALVNNAGVYGPRGRFEDLDESELRAVLDTNVVGLMSCSQQAIRRMSTRHGGGGGGIVNVSSGSAYIGNAGDGVQYAVSKGAVNSFTIGLSQELAGEGIRVNAVSPGVTRTDMPPAAKIDAAAASIPAGRAGEPEEIAEAIAWLLSDRASYVAGANIRVAGGRP